MRRQLHRAAVTLAAVTLATVTPAVAALPDTAVRTAAAAVRTPAPVDAHAAAGTDACPPSAVAVGYSDALDKLHRDGAVVGGLSSLAYDARAHTYASAVDNDGTQPARIWFFRDLADPQLTGPALILRRPDGTPYDGLDSDNEGLAVLPDGDYLVSSETEPSIRIFGRDGVQRSELPVPARFAVTGTTPAGQASSNKTLEGLSISPSGRTVVAAMEGPLSGDLTGSGQIFYHRFLVYRRDGAGVWQLRKQVGYRAEPGQRIPEVAAYSDDKLLVEEASYSPDTGNTVKLWAVDGLRSAASIGAVADLATAPARDLLHKTLVANVVQCPTLGAPAKETQANPLLDNVEGMAITSPGALGVYRVSLISDDNFSAGQTTRVLNLDVRLP